MMSFKYLLIEPFNSGSHKQLIDILLNKIPGTYAVTLPGKKWHWKARTSALYLSQVIPRSKDYKSIFASSVLNLAELVALRPDLAPLRKVLYFHENQLVYPVRKSTDQDFQYGYNQILSCLVADTVLFNSEYNRESFLSSIATFLKLIPYERPSNISKQLRPKCHVLHFPIEFPQKQITDTAPTTDSCDRKCDELLQDTDENFRTNIDKGDTINSQNSSEIIHDVLSEVRTSDMNREDFPVHITSPNFTQDTRKEKTTEGTVGLSETTDAERLESVIKSTDDSLYRIASNTCEKYQRIGDDRIGDDRTKCGHSADVSPTSCRKDESLCSGEYTSSGGYLGDSELPSAFADGSSSTSSVPQMLGSGDESANKSGEMSADNSTDDKSVDMSAEKSGEKSDKSVDKSADNSAADKSTDRKKFKSNEEKDKSEPLHIVWPHRWEHDKGPEAFFKVMFRLREAGLKFRLSVLGEDFSENPDIFDQAFVRLQDVIDHWGFQPSKGDYYNVLRQADCVVSTSDHEFFGVAMLEAVHLGCYPLCPNRLVYPEIFQKEYLYNTDNQLFKRLRDFCIRPHLVRRHSCKVDTSQYEWKSLEEEYIKHITGD